MSADYTRMNPEDGFSSIDRLTYEEQMAWAADESVYMGQYPDDDAALDYEDDYDGQPSEYEEWQDYYGGDDWDHGQYDDHPVYGEDY